MFERYTEKARQSMHFARSEAAADGSLYIETTHLLLGILRANPDLKEMFGDLETVRRELSAEAGGPSSEPSTDLPLSHACRQVLARAADEAKKAKNDSISTLHLLAGLLLTEPYDPAHTTIARRGVTLEAIRARLGAASEPVGDHPGFAPDALKVLPPDRRSALLDIARTMAAEASVEVVVKTAAAERSYRFS